jgi:hypothetical protein
MRKIFLLLPLAAAAMGSAAVIAAPAPQPPMTFFVTSNGPGKGGDLGGLAGADAHCQMLAAAAGQGNRTWRAYLSTQGANAVNARDRIGKGPWHNAKGVEVGKNPDAIHGITHPFSMDRIVTEEGALIPNGNFEPNRHDILTGSTPDGKATTMTCQNWTSSAADSSAMLGHHDRLTFGKPGSPWNSAHPSKGCSQENLVATGGAGLLYCFAAN